MNFIKIKDFCFSNGTAYISAQLHFRKMTPLAAQMPYPTLHYTADTTLCHKGISKGHSDERC